MQGRKIVSEEKRWKFWRKSWMAMHKNWNLAGISNIIFFLFIAKLRDAIMERADAKYQWLDQLLFCLLPPGRGNFDWVDGGGGEMKWGHGDEERGFMFLSRLGHHHWALGFYHYLCCWKEVLIMIRWLMRLSNCEIFWKALDSPNSGIFLASVCCSRKTTASCYLRNVCL